MAVFRLQDNAPDVYKKESRDFQLFCNIFDCLYGSLKYDIDSIRDIVDTVQCNERLIPLLQTKLGFWTTEKISAESLRIILRGFIHAVRHKGSLQGVEEAVQLFLKVKNIKTSVDIEINNENVKFAELNRDNRYTVVIGTEENLGDTTILDEILKYILPAGYAYRYVFHSEGQQETGVEYRDSVRIITGKQELTGAVKTKYSDEYPDIIDNVNLTVVAPDQRTLADQTAEKVRDPEEPISNYYRQLEED